VNLAMAKAVADCFWLHIHAPGCNNNVHSLEDVDLFGVCYLVLKALNEEVIETAPIISVEASDNSCVARLKSSRSCLVADRTRLCCGV
jgi:hypothetical protein